MCNFIGGRGCYTRWVSRNQNDWGAKTGEKRAISSLFFREVVFFNHSTHTIFYVHTRAGAHNLLHTHSIARAHTQHTHAHSRARTHTLHAQFILPLGLISFLSNFLSPFLSPSFCDSDSANAWLVFFLFSYQLCIVSSNLFGQLHFLQSLELTIVHL